MAQAAVEDRSARDCQRQQTHLERAAAQRSRKPSPQCFPPLLLAELDTSKDRCVTPVSYPSRRRRQQSRCCVLRAARNCYDTTRCMHIVDGNEGEAHMVLFGPHRDLCLQFQPSLSSAIDGRCKQMSAVRRDARIYGENTCERTEASCFSKFVGR